MVGGRTLGSLLLHQSPWSGLLPTAPAPHDSPQDPVAPADGLSSLQVCVPWEEDITLPVVGEEAGDLRDWGLAGTGKACLFSTLGTLQGRLFSGKVRIDLWRSAYKKGADAHHR